MDIRAYFTSSRKNTTNNGTLVDKLKSNSSKLKSNQKKIIDSDSDDLSENFRSSKEGISKNTRSKRIFESSDESDSDSKRSKKPNIYVRNVGGKGMKNPKKAFEISDSSSEDTSLTPKKKQKLSNKPLNVEANSKFFKHASAADVFGEAPVKRIEPKLKELRKNLQKRETIKNVAAFNDEAFEATLLQMDEVGDNWVNWKKIEKQKKVDTHPLLEGEIRKNEKNHSNEKEIVSSKKIDVNSKIDLTNEKTTKTTLTSLLHDVVSSDSGYDSQPSLLTDSQNSETAPVLRIEYTDSKPTHRSNITEVLAPPVKLAKNEKVRAHDLPELTKSSVDSVPSTSRNQSLKTAATSRTCDSLWVDKYKPESSAKIIGQQSDKSNVKKLIFWLNNWYKNDKGSKKATFVPQGWSKDVNGTVFKAALLSGPPGVGKTTTVSLVCKELGYDIVELNASDTRSKKSLQEEVGKLLKNTSLMPYFSKEGNTKSVTKKHVLVMDEVDGMAGTEDRGGVQELIQLIKSSKVPIICLCNDRNHPKIRSLANYCFDLRFSRPRVEQIKGFVRSICFKEKLNISSDAITDIITSANNDIRLILNHLSMLAAHSSKLEASTKFIKMNAWDVLRKVFSKEEHKKMNIHDKCDLFFFDYSIAPLFVQENYLSVKPWNVKKEDKRKSLELFASAADCISRGDIVDKNIRQNMAWSLLPTQAIFASYAPGEILEGYCGGQINFPSWLGKHSRQNKLDRLLQEVQMHTRLKVSATKESINLDYAPHLRNQIMGPLIRNGARGVEEALDVLHEYQLLKEDLDNLHEICQWPNSSNTITNLDSKVKSAFTRLYNKNPPMRPYSLSAAIKKGTTTEEESLQEKDDADCEEEISEDEADAMIIVKKKQIKKNEVPDSTSKTKPRTGGQNKMKRKK